MSRLIMIGAGGHACVLTEALRAAGQGLAGFVTNEPEVASGVMRAVGRFGSDQDLMAQGPQGVALINGIGTTGKPEIRRGVFETFRAAGFTFASVIHPAACVASDVSIGEGAQIMAGAVLQPGTCIGMNVIINTGAILDHDVDIGNHVHIAPGACLAGNVTVGVGTHIGAGATIIQGMRIGAGALIAAGAVVVHDVTAAVTMMGVPAREVLHG